MVPTVPVEQSWWCSTCGRQRAAHAHTHTHCPVVQRNTNIPIFYNFIFLLLARPYHSTESQTEIHNNSLEIEKLLSLVSFVVRYPFLSSCEICEQTIPWAPVIMDLIASEKLFHSNYPRSRNRYSVRCMRSCNRYGENFRLTSICIFMSGAPARFFVQSFFSLCITWWWWWSLLLQRSTLF